MKKIIYSPGEPSGIGPDLIIQLCTSKFWTDIKLPIVCLADPILLTDRASKLGKKLELLQINDLDNLNSIKIINMKKNRGHARCNAAGLKYINEKESFDYVIPMDGDGEDRPEEIKLLIEKAKGLTLNIKLLLMLKLENKFSFAAIRTIRKFIEKCREFLKIFNEWKNLDMEAVICNLAKILKPSNVKNLKNPQSWDRAV